MLAARGEATGLFSHTEIVTNVRIAAVNGRPTHLSSVLLRQPHI